METVIAKEGTNLPTVNEQLQTFCNSQDLALFYRRKLSEYEIEHTAILTKLKDQQKIIEYQYGLEVSLRLKVEEINELQKSVSQMQMLLFQEREHVLHLFAENDALKIKSLEDRKKLRSLLNNNQQKDSLQDANITAESLQLQVKALEEQLKSQRKLASVEIQSLMEELKVCQIERDAENQEYSNKISDLTLRLKSTQSMLSKSTEELLSMKSEYRGKEEMWAKGKLQTLSSQPSSYSGKRNSIISSVKIQNEGSKDHILTEKLKQSNKEVKFYKEKCSLLQKKFDNICSEKESNENLMSNRMKQCQELLTQVTSRYSKLQQRRNYENEGFKTDIMNLKSQLRYIEKQMYQIINENEKQVQGLQVLTSIKNSTTKSNKVSNELLELKRKMYQLEKDFERM
ncbi:Coiled-coil domain-containing protein 77 [Nymphon striatum]|nr:Coiled-coil domain-containing protein 77 [Nymphon striatum]